jgi:hypothetical protein
VGWGSAVKIAAPPAPQNKSSTLLGGTATFVAAVGEGVCDAELSAELLAGCGAVVTIVLLCGFSVFLRNRTEDLSC